jgi:serine/threonine-protein kinase
VPKLVGETLLDRYEVVEFIAHGGMADVYKVRDTSRVTYLAMKLLNEQYATDRVFMRRFEREAGILMVLQHPNIVRFYSFEQEGPYAFMLLDFVQGKTLKREIFDRKGPLPIDRIQEILQPVCSALNFAHDEKLVHCDIKASNIMIEDCGKVQLADFGIARMTDVATVTMVGTGTPAYMAPEQVLGKEPTPQTDIYGLGILLYEMLTGGERPFTGETVQTGTTSERIRWEQMHVPPPSPRQYNPDISRQLEAVVYKCLAKDPSERYTNVMSLLQDLEMQIDKDDLTIVVPKESPKPPQPVIQDPLIESGNIFERELSSEQKVSPNSFPIPRLRSRRGLISAVIVLILLLLAAIFVVFPWVIQQLESSGILPNDMATMERLVRLIFQVEIQNCSMA